MVLKLFFLKYNDKKKGWCPIRGTILLLHVMQTAWLWHGSACQKIFQQQKGYKSQEFTALKHYTEASVFESNTYNTDSVGSLFNTFVVWHMLRKKKESIC